MNLRTPGTICAHLDGAGARGLFIRSDNAVTDVDDTVRELGDIRLMRDQHDGVAAMMEIVE
jgi:hypothetical protein